MTFSVIGNVRSLAGGLSEMERRSSVVRAAIALELSDAQIPVGRTVFYVPSRSCLEPIAARYGVPAGTVDPAATALVERAFEGEGTDLPTGDNVCDPTAWPGLR